MKKICFLMLMVLGVESGMSAERADHGIICRVPESQVKRAKVLADKINLPNSLYLPLFRTFVFDRSLCVQVEAQSQKFVCSYGNIVATINLNAISSETQIVNRVEFYFGDNDTEVLPLEKCFKERGVSAQ